MRWKGREPPIILSCAASTARHQISYVKLKRLPRYRIERFLGRTHDQELAHLFYGGEFEVPAPSVDHCPDLGRPAPGRSNSLHLPSVCQRAVVTVLLAFFFKKTFFLPGCSTGSDGQ